MTSPPAPTIPIEIGTAVPAALRAAVAERAAKAKVVAAPEALAELIGRLHATYTPLQIWLFGSRARGDHRDDSGWDIAVIVADDTPDDVLELDLAWETQRGSGVQADIIAIRQRAFLAEVAVPNTVSFELGREGALLFSASPPQGG